METGATPAGLGEIRARRGRSAREDGQDFAFFWKAPELGFGKHENSIAVDFKDPARFFDQFGIHTQFGFKLYRQTGGSGVVVSHSAIFDFDLHSLLPTWIESQALPQKFTQWLKPPPCPAGSTRGTQLAVK